MLAGVSFAGASPAMAQGMQLEFMGSIDYQIAFFGGDQAAAGTGTHISAVDDQSELTWHAHSQTDSGLVYGGIIDWRYLNGNTGTFDESFLYFEGDWGRVHFGSDDDVVDNMATGANDVQAHSEGFDGEFGDYYNQIGDAGFLGTSGSSGDANKIAYFTPNFAGFEGGLSYSPNDTSTGQAASTNGGTAVNIIEASLGYGAEFDGFAFSGSLGFRNADAEDSTSGNELEDHNAWRVGAKIGFGPVEFGAGYGDNGDSACVQNTICDAGENYQLGFGWDYGLGRFALGYAYGENTNTDGTEDQIDVYNISIDAGVADGLTVYGDLVHADSTNGGSTATSDNAATILLIGTAINF